MLISLKKYLKEHWQKNGIVLFWIIVGSAVTVGWGWVSANALTALVELDFQSFIQWMLIMLGVFLVWCLQIYMQTVSYSKALEAMNISMREDITNRIAHYTYSDYEKHSEGTYVSWLTNDITTINYYGFGTLSMIVTQLFTVLFSIVAIINFHYSLLITISILALIVLNTPKLFSKRMNERMTEMTQGDEQMTTKMGDVMNGYSSLFMMNLRQFIVSKARGASEELASKKIAYAKVSGLMSASTNGASLFSQIIVIAQTGFLYIQGLVPVGAMNGTQYFAANIFASLTGLSANLIELKTVQPIFDKFEKIDIYEKDKPNAESLSREIRMVDVSYRYTKMKEPVIQSKTFSFKKGEKIGVFGASGTGKSTLLNLLTGKLEDYSGTIFIDDLNYRDLNMDSIRDQIIYLEQTPHLFNISLKENITLSQSIAPEIIQNAIDKAGLTPFVHTLTEGLETLVETNGKNFSGGQKQRIALARGLASGKEVVLFDEATASLDEQSAKEIEDYLMESNLTVIIVSHHVSEELRGKFDTIYQL